MRYAAIVLLCLAVSVGRANGQFGLSSDLQLTVYRGVSRDTSAGNLGQTFRPYRPILVTVRPEWTLGRIRVAVGISYGTPDLAEDGDPLAVVLHNMSSLLEFSPEVSYGVVQLPRGTVIRVHAGPLVSVWNLKADEGARTRAGGLLAVSTEFPLTSKLHGEIRLSGAVTSGLLRQSDLPPGFEVQGVRRVGIGLGLRYGP
jgi:hypothetical protein